MPKIDISSIKKLRDRTGAGVSACQQALKAMQGDLPAAIVWLREKGIVKAADKSGRTTKEGVIALFKRHDKAKGYQAALVEINSETDFVARNSSFQSFAKAVAECAASIPKDKLNIDYLLKQELDLTDKTDKISNQLKALIARTGENIKIRRASCLCSEDGIISSYIHNSYAPNLGRIGVLISLRCRHINENNKICDKQELDRLGHLLAMHICASRPLAITADAIDRKIVLAEEDIIRKRAASSGKKAQIIDKIVSGSLRKWYSEVALLSQVSVLDNKTKIKEMIIDSEGKIGMGIEIEDFTCFALGEDLE